MITKAEQFNKANMNAAVPDVRTGDTVKVHQKIKEGDKERIQIFEGVVIARKHGKGITSTITVRKVVEQVGVERIFPVHAPFIAKIEVVTSGKVRRSKLYYLREAKGKKSRLKKREFAAAIAPASDEISGEAKPEAVEPETATTPAPEAEKTGN